MMPRTKNPYQRGLCLDLFFGGGRYVLRFDRDLGIVRLRTSGAGIVAAGA
jgi:hypothetical protein